jgi:hypothetical protein
MKCVSCRKKIKQCDRCGEKFEIGGDVNCTEDDFTRRHFCSEECVKEYYEPDIIISTVIRER